MNTRSSSFKPYFLTAHHCISSSAEARSVQAFFLYQDSVCNGTPPSLGSVPSVLGATYLTGASISQGDYSFLLLTSAPSGLTYLGWNFNLALNAPVTGVHHPKGSYKRISFGSRSTDIDITVDGELAPANLYYQVPWSSGVTEPGSSGSPLINSTGQVYGSLTAGPVIPPGKTACDITQWASYGRFDNTYDAIKPYLEDSTPASLVASPAAVTFQITDGAVAPPSQQTVSITTQSQTALSLTTQPSQPWIRVTGGTSVSASSPATISISVDPTMLTSAGTIQGAVTVSSASTSVSVGVQATVTISRSNVVLTATPNPVYQQAPDSNGYSWFYTIRATESSAVDTTLTGFKIDGIDYSSQIASFFGSTTLSRNSSLAASLRTKDITPPLNRTFELDGIDAINNRPWQAVVVVPFLGSKTQPVTTLTSSPDPVRQNPAAASNCQWSNTLVLKETAGVAMTVTRFLAAGYDLSAQISSYFGSSQLKANGTLQAKLCWPSMSTPATLAFEVDGTGPAGDLITAKVSGSFLGPLNNTTTLVVSPSSVSMNAPAGFTNLINSGFDLTLGSANANWTASLVAQGSDSSWLVVYPLSGTGSAHVNVIGVPAGRAIGILQATLIIQAPTASPQSLSIPVTLQISGSSKPSTTAIVNSASYATGPLAPGENIVIFGNGIGPSNLTQNIVANSPFGSLVANTRVLFDGIPAPILYASANQTSVMVPYGTYGRFSTSVVVEYGGVQSNPVVFNVAPSAPAIYTLSQSGTGQGAIINQDGYTTNTPATPEIRGNVITVYMTGEGQTSPPGSDGAIIPPILSALKTPVLPVSATIGGIPATVLYAGSAAGLISGVMQVNVRIPANAPIGSSVPIVITVGSAATQTNVTLAVSEKSRA
jgi:uncharacterized protein (TIGR03437 family)